MLDWARTEDWFPIIKPLVWDPDSQSLEWQGGVIRRQHIYAVYNFLDQKRISVWLESDANRLYLTWDLPVTGLHNYLYCGYNYGHHNIWNADYDVAVGHE